MIIQLARSPDILSLVAEGYAFLLSNTSDISDVLSSIATPLIVLVETGKDNSVVITDMSDFMQVSVDSKSFNASISPETVWP